jgi:hypothetical protein
MIEVTISPAHVGDADLNICLINSGPYEYLNVIFVIRLPAGVMWLRGQERIGPVRLPPGKSVCEKLRVRVEKPGRYMLTSPSFSYRDHNGRTQREAGFTKEIIVDSAPAPVPELRIRTEPHAPGRRTDPKVAAGSASGNPTPAPTFQQSLGGLVKVLYLAARPVVPANQRNEPLRVDEEFRQIQQAVSQGRERDRIQLESRWAVQPHDITHALFAVKPYLVHFAGHGDAEEGSIVVGDENGHARIIPADGLVKAFQAAGRDVRCVIVNACSTERLAQALAATGLCVIGMRQPVGDRSAIRFSVGFYQALADGQSVEIAFDTGVAQLKMTPVGDDRAPFLLCGGQAAH